MEADDHTGADQFETNDPMSNPPPSAAPTETQNSPPENINNSLWVDPLATEKRFRSGAVLLAEDIRQYVLEYNVLINKNDFLAGEKVGAKLKGASYTMSPHPTEAWTFLKASAGKVIEAPLKKGEDSAGQYYIVPKNSLVFIKLRQELRVPFYMIGRHNLKIRYVYKGLLLGTGPQVDPGYVGNLIIPLHNFTVEDVHVHIDRSFVSIDFVRTSPLFQENETNAGDIDQLYFNYEKRKCLIERDKVEKRRSLADYLEGSMPQSQMGKFEYDFGQLKEDTKRQLQQFQGVAEEVRKSQTTFETALTRKWEQSRRFKSFEVVAVIGVLGLILNLYRLQERDTESRGLELHSATMATNFLNYEFKLQRNDLDTKTFVNAAVKKVEDIAAQLAAGQSTMQSNLQSAEVKWRASEIQWLSISNNLQKAGYTNVLKP